jgi:RNA polymerase sigma-70 factor (ECF subfamily)
LRALDAIDDRRLEEYPFYAAARGDLLQRLGRAGEAAAELSRALATARNPADEKLLSAKLSHLINRR